jgi:hypothetical protein
MMLIVKILKRGNKSNIVGIVFILVLLMVNCTNKKCTSEEKQMMNNSSGETGFHQVKLSLIFPFEWDELYVVSGPRFPDEVTELTGVNYDNMIPDDTRQYIFVNDGIVTRDQRSGCKCLEYSETSGNAVTRYTYNSSVAISCKDVEGELICRVQSK